MRRRVVAVIFVLVVLTVLVGLHVYLAEGLVYGAGLSGASRSLALAVLWTLAGSRVLAPIAERRLGPPRARWLAWPAAVWMGLAFLLVTLLAASDLALWLVAGAALAEGSSEASLAASSGPARALAILGVGVLLGAVALRSGLGPPGIRRLELTLSRWPRALDGYRIVQISDVHIGPILGRRFAAELVERVAALEPDLLAVTGDLVDGPVARLEGEVAPLAGLHARDGVWFVTGNHDHYSGADDWVGHLRSLGLRVLRNERVTLGTGDAVFDLAGVEDHHAHLMGDRPGEDLEAALRDRDPARPLVLLAHDPSTFKRASQMGVDLQLSGHTHGGQIWPFSLLVRLAVPFVAGLYQRDGSRLYVSRGTGFWGPPMRLLAPAEITEIVLRAPGVRGA
ncbi:MAG: metallophosphoesterase [Myxococcota bacterium]